MIWCTERSNHERYNVIVLNITNIIWLFFVFWKLLSKSTWVKNLRGNVPPHFEWAWRLWLHSFEIEIFENIVFTVIFINAMRTFYLMRKISVPFLSKSYRPKLFTVVCVYIVIDTIFIRLFKIFIRHPLGAAKGVVWGLQNSSQKSSVKQF